MKSKLLLIVALILMLISPGCAETSKVYPMEPDEDQRDIALSDMLGGQLRLEEAAQRLLVLSPSACEIIFDLGAGERIIARGESCVYPKELSTISEITFQDLFNSKSMEEVEGDLIIIDAQDLSLDEINRLYKAGRAVLLLDVKNVEDIYRSTEIIGRALGKNLAAKELVLHMSNQWEALLESAGEDKKVSIYIENQEIPPRALGRDSLISYFLEKLGYENTLKERENRSLSLKEIETLDPDYILKLGKESPSTFDKLTGLRAVEEKNIYYWTQYPSLAGSNFIDVLKDLMKLLK